VIAFRDGAVGRVVLNRPDAMNAITVDLGDALEEAIRRLGNDPEVRVVLIRGAGDNFCVGGDFLEVDRLRANGTEGLRPLFENFGRACAAIAEVEAPVVVAIEGYAMAGGFELMLAADIALVRDDAKLADNHSNFGQIPGGGSSQRLPRYVSTQRALGLILSGERLTGQQAAQWGLAYRSFAPAEFETGVAAFVDALATKVRPAVVEAKRLIHAGRELPLSEGLAMERAAVIDFMAGAAGADGVAKFKARSASQ
jgi:enoyl-CoA hydratase/carnithine racemase